MPDFASNGAGRVAVLPDRAMVRGIDHLGATGTPIQTWPLVDAFTKTWGTDAHFVCYVVEPFDPSRIVFRLNKPIFDELIAAGLAVKVYLFAVDFDTEGHQPWSPDVWNDFLVTLKRIDGTAAGDRLKQAFASYPTRKGWRWVFRVKDGIWANEAEPYIRGLLMELHNGGLPVDLKPVLATWNCDFRLPCVMRDGRSTVDDPFFVPPEIHVDRFIEISSLVPQGKPDTLSYGTLEGPMPEDFETEALLRFVNQKGNQQDTDFAKEIKKNTKGTVFYSYAFEPVSFEAAEGERHKKVVKMVATAAGYVANFPGATANHLYALFLPIAKQLEFDCPGQRRKREVWSICAWVWAHDQVNRAQEKKKTEENAEAIKEINLTGKEQIIQAVRRWFPGLPRTEEAEWRWIEERLILRTRDNKYHVMKTDGFYSVVPTDPEGLLARIRQLKMDKPAGGHIVTWVPGKQGERPVKRDELALNYVRNVDRVEIRPEIEGAYLLNPHKDEGLVLVRPSFRRRRDLVPEYSPDVDALLQAYAGYDPAVHRALELHVASFLAFERGGTAAMSFNLMPGSGKKLITHGFLECMEDPEHATGDDLVQRFNSRLSHVPFLLMNEGLPEARHAYNHPADTFRRVITGDYFQSEAKGVDAVTNKAAIRIIMTANHWRLIDALGEGRDLSSHEREALGIRLVHYDSEDAPGKLLRSKGGLAWTAGWIEGDGGEPSRFVVARHFLWLYEKYGRSMVIKGRLLVEGDPNQAAIRRLRARGGSTPVVTESIVGLLKQSAMGAVVARQGIKVTADGCLSVTAAAILDYWRNNLTRGSGDRLTINRITMSLKGLVVGMMESAGSPSIDKARYHEIDVFFLADEAREAGWLCPELDRLVELRRAALVAQAGGSGNGNGNGAHADAAALARIQGGA